jgi:Uma2 family endonuclease
MSAVTVIQQLPDEKRVLYALTVDQYHQMVAEGILPEGEPFELIHGQVTRKDRSATGEDVMTVGEHHIWCVKRLAKLGPEFERLGCHLQTQQPVSLPPFNEPEPDAAIVIGNEDRYLEQKPVARDVTCVIEVSDSSLNYDRTVKLPIYADSGIPVYFIVNLKDRVIEVYSEPEVGAGRYAKDERLSGAQLVRLPAAGGAELPVPARHLLP